MTIKTTGLSNIEVANALRMFANEETAEGLLKLHELIPNDGVTGYLLSIDDTLAGNEDFLHQLERFVIGLPEEDECIIYAYSSAGSIEGIVAISDWDN